MSSLLPAAARCAGEIALGCGSPVVGMLLGSYVISSRQISDSRVKAKVMTASLAFASVGAVLLAYRLGASSSVVGLAFHVTCHKISKKKNIFCASPYLWGAAVPVIKNLALLALNRR